MNIEKVNLNNVVIDQLLTAKFVDKIKELDLNAISLVLIPKDTANGVPIIISHENSKEINDKKIHIMCLDQKMLNSISDKLKELGAE